MSQLSAATRDKNDWQKQKFPASAYFRHAQKKSGRSAVELAQEFWGLHFGRGKLTLPEYIQYRVYEANDNGRAEKERFITNTLHWPITYACCDQSWMAATEDKWLCSHILAKSSVATPETLAVIDKTERNYPGTRKISTANDLRDFAMSPGMLPCFGKEIRGICSFGAFLILEADNERIHLKGEGWLDYETCFNEFVGDTPYLIQPLVKNHSFFSKYTDNLATIRVCILVDKDEVKTPFAVLKLPSKDNLADSFWRPGNLSCGLNPDNGEILTARLKDNFETADCAEHPETGAKLLGERLPQWSEVMDLVRNCAPIFHPVRYQSMDIAVTDQGPMLIEINTGGGFDLPQLASGKGFLTDEVCDFFRSCGYRKI
ncbi:sugar-transfer associated ATP-grasp domain-containing protein [Hyphococcus sp.]|uniref:sugar-transfer associated ATP-grasp domain-containing protein n=1 Tax=Hyphococcus sp. TaxID=2038636 RepID=UPI00208D9E58|nr:MAG: hypothetical protein DHS20C04_25220 [Marinicaulis sp.]